MTKTLGQMTAEVRDVNTKLGWRADHMTFGDRLTLLHTELSEIAEEWRDHRLDDATRPVCGRAALEGHCPEHGLPKPLGVGSEFADVLIRLVDLCDVFRTQLFDMDMELGDVAPLLDGDLWTDWLAMTGMSTWRPETLGDWISWLHYRVSCMWQPAQGAPYLLRALVTVAERFGVDLHAEYERKIAYQRTRPYQHGGRTMSGPAGQGAASPMAATP